MVREHSWQNRARVLDFADIGSAGQLKHLNIILKMYQDLFANLILRNDNIFLARCCIAIDVYA